jgi:linoleoyl-CoA desaturase
MPGVSGLPGGTPPGASRADFPAALRRRIQAYFREQNLSPKANSMMVAKVAFGLTAWVGTYAGLYALKLDAPAFVALYVVHGLVQLFLLLNITHDSNHNAISGNVRINRLLSHVMDLCGINSRMWRVLHHTGHHSCVNVHGEDEAILGRGLLRFAPAAPFKKIHQFQHLYAFPLYSFFSLDYILIKDFEYSLAGPPQQNLSHSRYDGKAIAVLFTTKLFYLTYMIVLPVVVLGRPLFLLLLAFLITHLVLGFLAVLVFQTSHVVETNQFPRTRTELGDQVYHVLATTADYATGNPLLTWLVGGLNHHVIHHLCPHVCHTHYGPLTRIVKETAVEYGATYREHLTVREALVHHSRLLKRLSRPL